MRNSGKGMETAQECGSHTLKLSAETDRYKKVLRRPAEQAVRGCSKDKIIRETVRGAVLYAFGKLHHIFPCNIRSQVAADDDAAVKYNVQVAEAKARWSR